MTRQRFMSAFCRALFDSDLVASRITLALAELLWAIMLFWPGDTFGRPTYTLMSHVANESVWAGVFLLSAVTQISIVAMEDFYSAFARYFAAWNAVLWCYTVASMLLSVYPPPAAIGGEVALALSAAWIWLRPIVLMEGYRRAARLTQAS